MRLLTLLLLLAPLSSHAAGPEPESGSLAALAGALTRQLAARFGDRGHEVVSVEGNRMVVAPGALSRGTELEVLREVVPLRDPATLERIGSVQQPIALARVISSNRRLALAMLERQQQPPRVGEPVRRVPNSLVLGLRQVRSSAQLAPALTALCAVLPPLLEQTGLFQVKPGPVLDAPLLGRSSLDAFRREATRQGLDLVLAVGLLRDQGELVLLAELVGANDSTAELWSLPAPLDAQARSYLQLGEPGQDSAQELMSPVAQIPGQVLALVEAPDGGLRALASSGLWSLARDGSSRLLVPLDTLEPARAPVRRPAGTLLRIGSAGGEPWLAFGSNLLAHGYLYGSGRLETLAAQPVAVSSGQLLLASYLPGQDVFDGELATPDGRRSVGAFLGLRLAPQGVVLQRPDLQLERLTEAGSEPLPWRSGRSWDLRAGTWVRSSADPATPGDQLELSPAEGASRRLSFPRPLSAVAVLDSARPELAVAETQLDGYSLLSVLPWP